MRVADVRVAEPRNSREPDERKRRVRVKRAAKTSERKRESFSLISVKKLPVLKGMEYSYRVIK